MLNFQHDSRAKIEFVMSSEALNVNAFFRASALLAHSIPMNVSAAIAMEVMVLQTTVICHAKEMLKRSVEEDGQSQCLKLPQLMNQVLIAYKTLQSKSEVKISSVTNFYKA